EQCGPVNDVPKITAREHPAAQPIPIGVGWLIASDGKVRILVGELPNPHLEAGGTEEGNGLTTKARCRDEPECPVPRIIACFSEAELFGLTGMARGTVEVALVADVDEQAGEGPVQDGGLGIAPQAPPEGPFCLFLPT